MQPAFTTRPDIRGTFGAVATTHWLATQTGMAVLERGGNAFDAAAAAGFVLQIVEPHLNGPGGELPAIVMRAGADAPEVICGQGPFPAAASAERLRGMGLAQMPGTGLAARRRARRVRRLDAAAARLRHAARCAMCSRTRSAMRSMASRWCRASSRRSFRRSNISRPNGRAPARSGWSTASRRIPTSRSARRSSPRPTSAFSPRRKRRAATASNRSRPRATRSIKASSPRRSIASTSPS